MWTSLILHFIRQPAAFCCVIPSAHFCFCCVIISDKEEVFSPVSVWWLDGLSAGLQKKILNGFPKKIIVDWSRPRLEPVKL